MYSTDNDTITLSWNRNELFRSISDETLSNARVNEDIEADAMTEDERYFFDAHIEAALTSLTVYYRRIADDREVMIATPAEVGIRFTARTNIDRQYADTDLAALEKLSEDYLRYTILQEWYVSVKVADMVKYYSSRIVAVDFGLKNLLFRFYRPASNGLGYSVVSVRSGEHGSHCSPSGNSGCGTGHTPLVGVRSVCREEDAIVVTYTDGRKELAGTLTDGESAYSLAVRHGFSGDEAAFLESLKGKDFTYGMFTPEQIAALQGPAGATGLSAYQAAVKNGFLGTEQQWLTSLHGRDGVDGIDGADTMLKLPPLEVRVEGSDTAYGSGQWLSVRIKGFAEGMSPKLPRTVKLSIARYVYQACNNGRHKKRAFKGYVIPDLIEGTGIRNSFIMPTAELLSGGWQKVMAVKSLAEMFISLKESDSGKLSRYLCATRRSRRKIIVHENLLRGISVRIGVCLVEPRKDALTTAGNVLRRGVVTPFRVGRCFYLTPQTRKTIVLNEIKL